MMLIAYENTIYTYSWFVAITGFDFIRRKCILRGFLSFVHTRKWSKMFEKMKKMNIQLAISAQRRHLLAISLCSPCGCRNFVIYFTWKLWFIWQAPAKTNYDETLDFLCEFSTEFGGWKHMPWLLFAFTQYQRWHRIYPYNPLNNRIRVTNNRCE